MKPKDMKRPRVLRLPLSRACLFTFAPCYQLLQLLKLAPSGLSLTARLRRGARACAVARSSFSTCRWRNSRVSKLALLVAWQLRHTEASTSTPFLRQIPEIFCVLQRAGRLTAGYQLQKHPFVNTSAHVIQVQHGQLP